MIALNDIGIANDALGGWMKDQDGIRKDRQKGAKNVLRSHAYLRNVYEAIAVINKINSYSGIVIDR